MDADRIARALVAEMTEAVERHIHPRTGVLVPPRLTGQRAVADLEVGEKVLDLVDVLLETAAEAWLPGQDPDVALDLLKLDSGWVIGWSIGPERDDAAAEPAEEIRE